MDRFCALLIVTVSIPNAAVAEPYCDSNPDVIYCNDFETSLDGIGHGSNVGLVTDGNAAFGSGALEARFELGAGFAAAEYGVRFAEEEQVYVRFYVRWDGAFTHLNHWIGLHGDGSGDWGCHGGAGCMPNGTRCLNGTGVDVRDTDATYAGAAEFYTYHLDMTCDSGGYCSGSYADEICADCAARGSPCTDGPQCCWGKIFGRGHGVSFERGRWYAFEFMVQANSVTAGVGNNDGLIVMWIDGVEVARQDGLRWRHDLALGLDHFIAWNYNPDADEEYAIRYDNLVVSRAPIGLAFDPPPAAPTELQVH